MHSEQKTHETPLTFSVVIPMHNEAENIPLMINEIDSVLKEQHEYEIIIVDDGSTDATPAVLQAHQATHPHLKPIRHKTNYGQSAAVVTGVNAARYEWIVTLDGDCQNDPADIPKLIAALNAEQRATSLLFIGHRTKRRDDIVKRLSSRIANGVRSTLLADNCPDTGCGLKLFSKNYFLRLPHFNHVHRYLPALVKRAGGRAISVPVNHRERAKGTSKYGVFNRLWVGIADLMGVAWLIRRPCSPVLDDVSS